MSVSDDYRDSFQTLYGYTADNTGTISDMQYKWLISIAGYVGPVASIRDMYETLNPTGRFKTLFSLF